MSRTVMETGLCRATRRLLDTVEAVDIAVAIRGHAFGSPGPRGDDCDSRENNDALRNGRRIISRWWSSTGVAFIIMSEPRKDLTTAMLDEEYWDVACGSAEVTELSGHCGKVS